MTEPGLAPEEREWLKTAIVRLRARVAAVVFVLPANGSLLCGAPIQCCRLTLIRPPHRFYPGTNARHAPTGS